MKQFLPFTDSDSYDEVLAIDCYAKNAFNLSHWRGAPKIAKIHGDTSTQITIRAIEENLPQIQYKYVTCNHFDIDGFLGVWSVFDTREALENKTLIEEIALIGDFRELKRDDDITFKALKLVCTINYLEQRYFYAPFAFKAREANTCVEKFDFFLKNFSKRFFDIDDFQREWEAEFNLVTQHLQILDSSHSRINNHDDLRLQVIETRDPLHYYALFAKSSEYDMVLSMYDNNRYELEYKYTTWVDTNRMTYPRIDLGLLAARLNAIETSGIQWYADQITDTGPILRLNKEKLPKEARYNHPFSRPIYSSSIPPDIFKEVVLEFFHQAYRNVTPKKWWTWQEMAGVNEHIKAAMA